MQLTLDGRMGLIAGAAQGIGYAITRRMKDAGAAVHVCDIDASGVNATANTLGVPYSVLDLSDRGAVNRMIGEVEESSGPIDFLVNSAGGVCGQIGLPIAEVGEGDWHAIFRANVDSAFWLAQAVGPGMARRRWGRIIFIASGAGLRPSLTGIQAYTAAKHALVGLTKQLSLEFGPYGVTVNAVAPGFVLSNPSTIRQWEQRGPEGQQRLLDAVHTRRLGTPEDISAAVLFLASESARWITGQVLSVDGGRS